MRVGIEAYNRRDIDAVLSAYHPDAQIELAWEGGQVASPLSEPRFSASEGLQRFGREALSAWGEFRIEPLEVIDLDDRAVLLGRVIGQGASSGLRLSDPYAVIFTFERGKIIGHREYADHAEALEAVGLEE
jgi:ketosteroid isomerase-like protein